MTTTKIIGVVRISGKDYMFLAALTDGTIGNMTIRDNEGTLRTLAAMFENGGVLNMIWLLAGTPSDVDKVVLASNDLKIIYESQGCINNALGHMPNYFLSGVAYPFGPGATLQCLTSD